MKEKARLQICFAKEADIVIRFQGGANAGHTIVNDYGKFALHTLPSGVFYSHITNIIGNGVALDIPKVFNEVNQLVERGRTGTASDDFRQSTGGNALSYFTGYL